MDPVGMNGVGSGFGGIFIFLVLIIGGFLFFRSAGREKDAVSQRDKLIASGFVIDHLFQAPVSAAFDMTKKRVAFIWSDMTAQYDFDDIKHWEWTWKEENGIKKHNSITFKINDINRPLLKSGRITEATAELWLSKLDVILGQS